MKTITLVHEGLVVTGLISDEDCARLYKKFDGRAILTVPESQEIIDCMTEKKMVKHQKAVIKYTIAEA